LDFFLQENGDVATCPPPHALCLALPGQVVAGLFGEDQINSSCQFIMTSFENRKEKDKLLYYYQSVEILEFQTSAA